MFVYNKQIYFVYIVLFSFLFTLWVFSRVSFSFAQKTKSENDNKKNQVADKTPQKSPIPDNKTDGPSQSKTQGQNKKANKSLSEKSNLQKIYILHHYPPSEEKISSALKMKKLSCPIYKIAVAKQGDVKMGLVQFGAGKYPHKKDLDETALKIITTAFRIEPTLSRIDVSGLEYPDSQKGKGKVLFFISASRDSLPLMDYSLKPGDILRVFGRIYYHKTVDRYKKYRILF